MTDRLERIQEFLRESPDDPFLHFALAQEYVTLKEFDEALTQFSMLRTAHPGYVALYYQMGKLQQALGKNEEAIGTFEEGMRIAKAQGEMHTYSELGSALMELKD